VQKDPVSRSGAGSGESLDGAFALAVINADYPDDLIVVRQQAPLVIGLGQGEFFCASDTPAIVPHTRAVLPLENGELARLTPLGVEVYHLWRRSPQKASLHPELEPDHGGEAGLQALHAQGNL
jgi:glucosamine--fructose-6-phosphate aminotransferase (isomerizing)